MWKTVVILKLWYHRMLTLFDCNRELGSSLHPHALILNYFNRFFTKFKLHTLYKMTKLGWKKTLPFQVGRPLECMCVRFLPVRCRYCVQFCMCTFLLSSNANLSINMLSLCRHIFVVLWFFAGKNSRLKSEIRKRKEQKIKIKKRRNKKEKNTNNKNRKHVLSHKNKQT